jgi:hypothetical protein
LADFGLITKGPFTGYRKGRQFAAVLLEKERAIPAEVFPPEKNGSGNLYVEVSGPVLTCG